MKLLDSRFIIPKEKRIKICKENCAICSDKIKQGLLAIGHVCFMQTISKTKKFVASSMCKENCAICSDKQLLLKGRVCRQNVLLGGQLNWQ